MTLKESQRIWNYFLAPLLMTACAHANLATGTRKGEQYYIGPPPPPPLLAFPVQYEYGPYTPLLLKQVIR